MSEKYHWSFGDNPMWKNMVFPNGFSAVESTLPSRPFDPSADWENAYDVVYTGRQDAKQPGKCYYGSLRLGASFSGRDVRLSIKSIRQTSQMFNCERRILSAFCECNRDELVSLKNNAAWSLKGEMVNLLNPQSPPFRNYKYSGTYSDGVISKTTGAGKTFRYRSVDPSMPLVSNWALAAAVQTLPRDREFRFNYFEDLECLQPGEHAIRFYKEFDAEFGGRKVKLFGYAHHGAGIIPSYYWLDESGRLLIARFGLISLVYNPEPMLETLPAKQWKGRA
jgi:hypothetical protein